MIVVLAIAFGRADAQPAHVARALHRVELQARALDALTRRYPLDYQHPFTVASVDHEARDRFLEVCEDGDSSACWRAATLDGWSANGKARARVVEHCRAGDQLSCRALPLSVTGFASLPGHGGREDSCRDSMLIGPGCDDGLLQSECHAGFSQSCLRLIKRAPSSEYGARIASAMPTARAGCEAGLEPDCDALDVLDVDHALVDFVRAQACPFRLGTCQGAPWAFRQRHDLVHARDAAERLCQYGVGGGTADTVLNHQRAVCLDLAEAYTSQVYPEPVPGRGEALFEWACSDPTTRKIAHACVDRDRMAARKPTVPAGRR